MDKTEINKHQLWHEVACRPEQGGGETYVEARAVGDIDEMVTRLVASGELEHAQRIHQRRMMPGSRERAVALMNGASYAPAYMSDGDRHAAMEELANAKQKIEGGALDTPPADPPGEPRAPGAPGQGGAGAEAPASPADGGGGTGPVGPGVGVQA